MFFTACYVAGLLSAQQTAKAEQARWTALTPEQQDRELRKREVEALERIARAAENTRRDVKWWTSCLVYEL